MDDEKETKFPGQIDAQLRRAFQEVESSPLPDKLLTLLEQLRAQETSPSGSDGESDAPGR